MPYETLITALLEEGDAKQQAVLRKAQAQADRLIEEANAAAKALEREADLQTSQEVARQRRSILGRAALSEREILSQAKHEVLKAVWQRATEKALALTGAARAKVLRALLDELLTAAPPEPFKVVIDSRERVHLENLLKEKGILFDEQHRDDLLLGLELETGGERLTNSLTTRLAKAKPALVLELNRMLFTP